MKTRFSTLVLGVLFSTASLAGGGEEFIPCRQANIQCGVGNTADILREGVTDPKIKRLIGKKTLFVNCSLGDESQTVYFNDDARLVFGKYRVYVNSKVSYRCSVKN